MQKSGGIGLVASQIYKFMQGKWKVHANTAFAIELHALNLAWSNTFR